MVAYVSEDAPEVERDEDPCEDGLATGTEKSDNEDNEVVLPTDPDDMYYCFKVTDAVGREVYTNVYRHVVDNTGPQIRITTADNVLTISGVDAGSGVDTDSITWKVLRSDDRCDALGTGAFNNPSDSITIQPSYDGVQICIRVEDNAGNSGYQATVLRYDSAVVVIDPVGPVGPVTPVDPVDSVDPVDPTVVDPGNEVVVNFPPANWDQLSDHEQLIWLLDNNPYQCLDTTKIGKDARCQSGGSALDDNVVVQPAGPVDVVDPVVGVVDPVTVDDPVAVVDPVTVDPIAEEQGESVSLRYNYDDDEDTVTVTASDGITGLEYSIDSDSCDDDADGSFEPFEKEDGVNLSPDDVEGEVTVCVRGATADGYEYDEQQVGENAVTAVEDDGTTDDGTTDEEDTGLSVWVIVAIVGAIAVVAVIVIMATGKRNN